MRRMIILVGCALGTSLLPGLLVGLLLGLVGCAGTGAGPGADDVGAGIERGDRSEISSDGLRRAEVDLPGVLYLRDGHQIGSFDAFLIPEAIIDYQRYSRKLSNDLEDMFKASLEQSLIDAANDAAVPIVREPGACVLQLGMGLVNVDLERASLSNLGTMTLVMEFRDTLSGDALLRYARDVEIESEAGNIDRDEQVQAAFDDLVASMQVGRALRAAGLANDDVREGCEGTLAARGRGMAPAVSGR